MRKLLANLASEGRNFRPKSRKTRPFWQRAHGFRRHVPSATCSAPSAECRVPRAECSALRAACSVQRAARASLLEQGYDVGFRVRAELGVQMTNMGLHRVLGKEQLLLDFGAAFSLGDEPHDLGFPGREAVSFR